MSIRTWKAEEVAREKRKEKPVLIDHDEDLEIREFDEEIIDEYGIPVMTKK